MVLIQFFITLTISIHALAMTKIKVGASPALSTAGLYIAYEKGYFKEEGLDVEILTMNSSTSQMISLLSSNQLQVGAGNITAGLYAAFAAGEKFKIVADKGHTSDQHQYLWLILKKSLVDSKKIKTLADLKGLKIGLPSIDGSSQQIVLDKILGSSGLSLKDVKLIKTGYPEMNLALKNNLIDGAIQLEPFIQSAVESGIAVKFASAQTYWPNQQSAVLIYSEDFIKQNRSIDAEKFTKAYLRGVANYNLALKERETWRRVATLINKHTKLDPEASWGKLEPVGLSDKGLLDLTSMKKDLEWYNQNGYLKTKIDLNAIVDLRYIKANK